MFHFHRNLAIALVAVLSVVLASPASAAPPPGMRWSDTAGVSGRSHYRAAPVVAPQRFAIAPTLAAPQFSSFAPVVGTPAAVAATPATSTVTVRGPDGTVRTFVVEGQVVQQGGPTTYAAVRGPDGVVRSFPGAVAIPSVPAAGPPPAPVVVYPPCRP